MRHHQRERIVGTRLDGGEDVGERETLVAQARRALAPLPPDAADATLLADARLVLEEQPQPLALMCICNLPERLRSPF